VPAGAVTCLPSTVMVTFLTSAMSPQSHSQKF
jgi:hypothetical protein